MSNYSNSIRAELNNQYAQRGLTRRTLSRNVNYVSASTADWDIAHDAETTYEEAENAFWGNDDEDDDMQACFFG